MIMNWLKIFKEKQNRKKCLVCHKKGNHTASVQYSYQGGVGEAWLCNKCAKQFDNMADEHDQSI